MSDCISCGCHDNLPMKELSIEDWKDEYLNLVIYVSEVSRKNSALRGLVRDMMAFVNDDEACEHCGHDVECVDAAQGELVLPYEGQCLMLDVFESRMRKLGVEVDE